MSSNKKEAAFVKAASFLLEARIKEPEPKDSLRKGSEKLLTTHDSRLFYRIFPRFTR